MKRQGQEDSCPLDLKKTADPSQVAKRILCKIPSMIQTQILNKTPILALLNWVDDRMDWRLVLALNKRFEMVCRDNNVLPRFGKHTQWARDFKRFLASLKSKRLYDEWPKEHDFRNARLWDDHIGLDLGVTGNEFIFFESSRIMHNGIYPHGVGIRITLVRPRYQRHNLPRKTRVIRSYYHADVTAIYNFVIGNPFDLELARQKGQEVSTFEYTYRAEELTPAMCFDEHDILYTMARGRTTTVFRKDLESPDPPTPIFEVGRACDGGQLAVGNGRLFVYVRHRDERGLERMLYCFDMRTGRRFETNDPQLAGRPIMDVQQDAIVFRGELIFRVTENGFEKRVMHGAYRRKRINQHSYITLERFFDIDKVFIISFVNNQIVKNFLENCDPVCEIGRYTENIFYLVEEHRRHVWFQEKPGDEPHLLFRDNSHAAFEELRWDLQIRKVIIPTRTRSLDRQESRQRKERRLRFQNLIDDTNVCI